MALMVLVIKLMGSRLSLVLQMGHVILDEGEDRLQLRIGVKPHNLSVICLEVHQVFSPEYSYGYHWHSS